MGASRGSRLRDGAVLLALACLLLLLLLLLREPPPAPLPAPPPEPPPAKVEFAPDPAPPPPEKPPDPPPPARRNPPPPATPEPEDDEGGPWSVTVLGPGDAPLPGAWIRGGGNEAGTVLTQKDGRAVLPWRPVKGELRIATGGAAPEARFVLREEHSILRFPDLLPLDVAFVDGANALPLVAQAASLLRDPAPAIPLVPVGDRFTLTVSPFERGERASVRLSVTPFEPAAPERGSPLSVAGTVSAAAARLLVTVVLRPEAKIRVAVADGSGAPAPFALLGPVHLDGEEFPVPEAKTDPAGRAHLHGVPELEGEEFVVGAALGGSRGSSEPVPLPGDGSEVSVGIRILREPMKPAGASGNLVHAPERPSGTAGLKVTVLRRGGSPAEGVRILVTGGSRKDFLARWTVEATTGKDGVAVVERLDADHVVVASVEPGFYTAPASLRLQRERVTPVEIRELPPAVVTTVVRVVDERVLSVPCARVEVEIPGGPPYAYLVDGVQHLEILTDAGGICSLPGLPPVRVRITASSGSARGAVEGNAGEVLVVTLTPPSRR